MAGEKFGNSEIDRRDVAAGCGDSVRMECRGWAHEGRRTSALVRIPDSSRTSQHVRKVPCVDGSELARAFFTYAALVGAAMCSARLWSRLVSSLVCSLAGVHLSVVKLGHGTGLAPRWRCSPGMHPTRCSRTRGRPRSRPSLRSEGCY